MKYGFLNFLATTIFLAALGLLYGTLGTLNMADIVRRGAGGRPGGDGGHRGAVAARLRHEGGGVPGE